jgi:hypothetical protein
MTPINGFDKIFNDILTNLGLNDPDEQLRREFLSLNDKNKYELLRGLGKPNPDGTTFQPSDGLIALYVADIQINRYGTDKGFNENPSFINLKKELAILQFNSLIKSYVNLDDFFQVISNKVNKLNELIKNDRQLADGSADGRADGSADGRADVRAKGSAKGSADGRKKYLKYKLKYLKLKNDMNN